MGRGKRGLGIENAQTKSTNRTNHPSERGAERVEKKRRGEVGFAGEEKRIPKKKLGGGGGKKRCLVEGTSRKEGKVYWKKTGPCKKKNRNGGGGQGPPLQTREKLKSRTGWKVKALNMG